MGNSHVTRSSSEACVAVQVSSVELERVVIASVPAVLEAAAVGITPPGGGPEQLVMFLVLDNNSQPAAPEQGSAPQRGSAQTANKHAQPAASSDREPSDASEQQPKTGDEQSHSQKSADQQLTQRAASSQETGSESGSAHSTHPAAVRNTPSRPRSTQVSKSQSSKHRDEGESHSQIEEKDEEAGSSRAGLDSAVAKATSLAVVAVDRVKTAVAPMLAEVREAAAPLTQQVQAYTAPLVAQVSMAIAAAIPKA